MLFLFSSYYLCDRRPYSFVVYDQLSKSLCLNSQWHNAHPYIDIYAILIYFPVFLKLLVSNSLRKTVQGLS
jgi:hypothetical protein